MLDCEHDVEEQTLTIDMTLEGIRYTGILFKFQEEGDEEE